MSGKGATIAAFVKDAPPGELSEVVTDIKALISDDPSILSSQSNAFQQYSEEQFTTTKLPGASQQVVVSPYNALGQNRYYDVESQSSFAYDHLTQKSSAVQSHTLESQNSDVLKSILKSFSSHAKEHYPASSIGVYPTDGDSQIALVLVSNKYSPNNFWNGRWRSHYLFDPSSGSITGSIKVDVHYYEDGNVRMLTEKPISASTSSSASATEVVKQIAQVEKKYQEDLNKAFVSLSEGAFKSLRRQLPITRQKVDWDKVGGYRLGQDIGGGRQR